MNELIPSLQKYLSSLVTLRGAMIAHLKRICC
jgi:hypothetical protein